MGRGLIEDFMRSFSSVAVSSVHGESRCVILRKEVAWFLFGSMFVLLCIQGWDKTFCLQFLGEGKEEFDEIHFFGDKTFEVKDLTRC